MRFDEVVHVLPGLVDGSAVVDDDVRAFVESDLRCQAELVRYRRLLRDLAALRDRRSTPPEGAFEATLAALDAAAGRPILRRISDHKGLAGAALGTAVVTAGAAAVMLARSRRRVLAA